MRTSAIFLLALVCFNAVFAVSLRKSAESVKTSFAVERLRFIGKKSQMARDIVAAVELHLSSGGKVDDVIALVEAALDDVQNRRAALNSEYIQLQSDLNAIIAKAEDDLSNENARLVVVDTEINRLEVELDNLATKIANLEQELVDLDNREDLVNKARANDVTTYAARKQRDENSINVLDQVINKLKSLQARGNSFLQVSQKDIVRALKRIPKSNPIQALVQLSTKFDAEKLQEVVEKLSQIQSAIQASYADDRNGEEESLQHYNALIAEISSIRSQKQQDLADAKTEQSNDQVALATNENEKDSLQKQIDLNTELLNTTKAQLADAIASYDARLKDADQAIQAIKAAIDILNQNRDDLQAREDTANYLNAPSSAPLVQDLGGYTPPTDPPTDPGTGSGGDGGYTPPPNGGAGGDDPTGQDGEDTQMP